VRSKGSWDPIVQALEAMLKVVVIIPRSQDNLSREGVMWSDVNFEKITVVVMKREQEGV
jgi:hypothetical protein